MDHGTILSLFNTGHNYNISLVTAQSGVEFLSLRVTGLRNTSPAIMVLTGRPVVCPSELKAVPRLPGALDCLGLYQF